MGSSTMRLWISIRLLRSLYSCLAPFRGITEIVAVVDDVFIQDEHLVDAAAAAAWVFRGKYFMLSLLIHDLSLFCNS